MTISDLYVIVAAVAIAAFLFVPIMVAQGLELPWPRIHLGRFERSALRSIAHTVRPVRSHLARRSSRRAIQRSWGWTLPSRRPRATGNPAADRAIAQQGRTCYAQLAMR